MTQKVYDDIKEKIMYDEILKLSNKPFIDTRPLKRGKFYIMEESDGVEPDILVLVGPGAIPVLFVVHEVSIIDEDKIEPCATFSLIKVHEEIKEEEMDSFAPIFDSYTMNDKLLNIISAYFGKSEDRFDDYMEEKLHIAIPMDELCPSAGYTETRNIAEQTQRRLIDIYHSGVDNRRDMIRLGLKYVNNR